MEKLNCKSLMIGDWVYNHRNWICPIVEIHKDSAVVVARHYGEEEFKLDDLRPIPLTTEILEKNGFAKSTPSSGIHAICYDLYNKKDKYNLTIADYNKYKRLLLDVDSEDSECFNIKCDYVHELQHALRFCRIEKEIIL